VKSAVTSSDFENIEI